MSRVQDAWNSERLRYVFIVALVVWMLLAPLLLFWQNYEIRQAQTQAANVLREHSATLAEEARIQKDFDLAVAKAEPALTKGQRILIGELAWIECALQSSAANCGVPPPSS